VTILSLGPDGSITQLFPHEAQSAADNFLEAGASYEIDLCYRASAPYGLELLKLFATRDELLQLPLETRMARARGLVGGLLGFALDFQAMHAVARLGFLRARLFHRFQQGLAILLQLRAALLMFTAGGLGLAQQIARGGHVGLIAAKLFINFKLLAFDLRAPRFELRLSRLPVPQLLAQPRAFAVALAEVSGQLIALILEVLQLRVQSGEFRLQVAQLAQPTG